ncbi:uncharacterized protein EKO05_0010490 [Ascochyta rabiei]|uniref:uncharacterized protein n=1 Tax=Didymella rabiei TaxID=5454 RepID=UPI00220BEB72|nr:uncharacterized protein EKO05_0010490 [Ascochyta rabiei]UPX20250.1 hypothetical protein EKO05_0010490 [Ascochyta rabiei]
MPSIVKSLSDVFTSLLELVWSFFTTAGDLVQKTASFILKFFSEIIGLFVNFFRGLVDLAGGIVGFVLGNVLMLGVLAAVAFGFLQYQRNQGNTVKVGNKKLN